MKIHDLTPLALLLGPLVGLGAAQTPFAVNVTVGPDPAPLGCPVQITFSNDRPGIAGVFNCSYRVLDAQGGLVFDPTCSPILFDLGPYGWLPFEWNQVDQSGSPVPPGDYWVEASFESGATELHPVTLGGTDAGLVLRGTATVTQTFTGENRPFVLCSPLDPGRPFWLLAALGQSPGIATCGGTLPLTLDPLLQATLVPNSLLLGSQGNLDGNGMSMGPRLDLPDVPSLAGVQFSTAFLVLDFQAPCVVRRVSPAHTMKVLP
ncbi:hypothetical protein [Engelhardtia mirabilis]|uniref:FlgD Ig-like domain-containing protein n=1 Tax=Engelhardtia mirabilis TaxID=2528011 RepID=A0A518BLC8_9BACT|nr:hypothetical protein Pla133_28690 [Planctomycetes bacterium Pla133]QDV02106.1 hypothetical protein Pla86_28680 [Planctomycetes bacterium Pla86]